MACAAAAAIIVIFIIFSRFDLWSPRTIVIFTYFFLAPSARQEFLCANFFAPAAHMPIVSRFCFLFFSSDASPPVAEFIFVILGKFLHMPAAWEEFFMQFVRLFLLRWFKLSFD